MNSLTEQDFTLPISFDESTNPDHLTEVTLGTHLELPDGSIPLVQKVASGRLSPVRARTMKEYDQQIADLKKENFNLKLRIFFLEERMEQRAGCDDEDFFKTNIELKVEVEGLKKELMDKQELLRKASQALETISAQHQVELVRARQHTNNDATSVKEAQNKIIVLQQQLEEKDRELKDKMAEMKDYEQRIQDFMFPPGRTSDVGHGDSNKAEEDQAALESQLNMLKNRLGEQDEVINNLREMLKAKDLVIEVMEEKQKDGAAEADGSEKRQQVDRQTQDKCVQTSSREDSVDGDSDSSKSKNHLKSYKKKIADLEKKLARAQDGLLEKDELIANLEAEKSQQTELEGELANLRGQLATADINILKRDKIIKSLADTAVKKQQESEDLEDQLKSRDDEINNLREKHHELTVQKYQGSEEHKAFILEQQDRIHDMEDQLRHMTAENRRLHKTIGRHEAEIARKMEELKKADEVLQQREDNLQDLREALRDEKHRNSEKSDAVTKHYQALLDDAQRQLGSQEKMLQRMSQSLRDKDKELQLAISQSTMDSKEKLLTALRDQLKDKDQAVEDAVEANFKLQEVKDNEILQLKMALRERERDLDKVNQMLLAAEDTIGLLESEARDKDKERRELTSALKAQLKTLQEENEKHENALEEKETIIGKLRNALAKGTQHKNSEADGLVLEQQQQQTDKESQLGDVANARMMEADNNMKDLLARLHAKDDEIKNLRDTMNRELSELNKKTHTLQSELNQKEYDLQRAGNENSTATRVEVQILKGELAHLNNELNQKDDLIERLRMALETSMTVTSQGQGSDRSRSQPDEVAEKELAERTEALTRSLRAEKVTRGKLKEVKRKLQELGIKDISELEQIQRELHQLREQQSSAVPSSNTANVQLSAKLQKALQSQMKEAKNLNKSLEAERSIYLNLGQTSSAASGNSEAFATELAAVQSLRKQLEDSIKRNAHLHKQLDKQLKESTALQEHAANTGGMSADIEKRYRDEIQSLKHELEEKTRLIQETSSRESRRTAVTSTDATTHTENFYWDSFLPSFRDLPRVEVPQEDELQHMNSDELRDLVHRLGQEVTSSRTQSERLHEQILEISHTRDDDNSSPGAASGHTDSGATLRQVENLKTKLTETERTKIKLQEQLDSILKSPKADTNNEIISVLKQQLSEARETLKQTQDAYKQLQESTLNNTSMNDTQAQINDFRLQLQQIQAQLVHTENVNELLKRQLEMNGSSQNQSSPGVIMQMANEMERLKAELSRQQQAPSGGKAHKSLIPIPAGGMSTSSTNSNAEAQDAIQKQMESIRKELHEERLSRKLLQGKLASTEQTVRKQTEKMKYYRGMLEDAGLVMASPQRSVSESNLTDPEVARSRSSDESYLPRSYSRSRSRSLTTESLARHNSSPGADLISLSPPTLSPQTSRVEFQDSDDPSVLHEQMDQLKAQLNKSNKIIKSLQHKQRLHSSSDTDNGLPPRPPASAKEAPVGDASRRLTNKEAPAGGVSTKPTYQEAALQAEVAALRQQLEASRREAEQLRHKLQDTGGDLDQSSNWDAFQENETLRARLSENEEQLGQLEHRLVDVLDSMEDMFHCGVNGNVDAIDVTPGRVLDLRDKLNAARRATSQLAAELQGHGGTSEEMSALGPASEAGSQASVSSAEKELANAKKKIGELQREKTELIKQVSANQERLLQAEATNSLLMQRYATLEKSHDLRSPDQSKFKGNQSQSVYEAKLAQTRQENTILATEIVKCRQERDAYLQQMNTLEQQLQNTDQQLTDKDLQLHKVKEIFDRKVKENTQLQDLLKRTQEQLANVEDLKGAAKHEADIYQEKFARVDKEKQKLQRSLAEKEDLNNTLKKRLAEEQATARKLGEEVKRLNQEIEKSSSVIGRLQQKLRHLHQGGERPHTSFSSSSEGLPPRPRGRDSSMERGRNAEYSIERGRNPSGESGSLNLPSSPEIQEDLSPRPSLRPSPNPRTSRLQDTLFEGYGATDWGTSRGLDMADWDAYAYRNTSSIRQSLPPTDSTVSKPYSPNRDDLISNNDSALRAQIDLLRSQLKAAEDRATFHRQSLPNNLPNSLQQSINRQRYELQPQGLGPDRQSRSLPTSPQHNGSKNAHPYSLQVPVPRTLDFNASPHFNTSSHTPNTDSISARQSPQLWSRQTPHKTGELNLAEQLEEIIAFRLKLEESEELNNRLRHLLEKCLNQGADKTSLGTTDLSILLDEMSKLRSQLLRTLSTNNALRQGLEDRLMGQPGTTQHLSSQSNNSNRGEYILGETYIDRMEQRNRDLQNENGVYINGFSRLKDRQPDQWDIAKETGVEKAPGVTKDTDCVRYSIYDTQRPPHREQVLKDQTPTRGDPQGPALKKIGSDLRYLYAMGDIDDYELLKKEIEESVTMVTSLEARLKERLRQDPRSSSPNDLELIKVICGTMENMRFCIKEQDRLVKLFWTSQLPHMDKHSVTTNTQSEGMKKEQENLRQQYEHLRKKYSLLKGEMKAAVQRLNKWNTYKEHFEEDVILNLTNTHKIIQNTGDNLHETNEYFKKL